MRRYTPGPWKICSWNAGKSFTVYRELQSNDGSPMVLERLLNDAGRRKRFRSQAAAEAAIAKATH